jgi:DNA-binding PadR family transcriptional regulator
MSLQGAAAALLLRRPAHGYELHSVLEAELGPTWMTKASQLYLTLGRMQRDGIVTVTRVNQTNRPDRQLLSLTPRGRKLAQEWLVQGDRPGEHVARLAVARVAAPDKFDAIAAAISEELNSRLRSLRALRPSAVGGFQLEAIEAEISGVHAALRWVVGVRDNSDQILQRPVALAVRSKADDKRSA